VPPEGSRHDAAPPLATVDPSITADQASVTARDQPPATERDQPSATERHFQAGWTLLRGNHPREAALELGAAADAGGTDPLAADARYFQAVALVKAGQGADAERALLAFLDHAPRSIRRGRAAVMLGRLLAGRGDVKTARAWFDSALADPDPDVAAAARTGLSGLAARHDRAP
jgi:TolA-binding protein